MSNLGVSYALVKQDVDKLKIVDKKGRLDYMFNIIEPVYFDEHEDYVLEIPYTWESMHRLFTGGKLEFRKQDYKDKYKPLCYAVLGGEVLYDEYDGYITLKTPEQVKDIAKALEKLNKEDCEELYYKQEEKNVDPEADYIDFDDLWEDIEHSVKFFKKAAADNRYVIFTVDF